MNLLFKPFKVGDPVGVFSSSSWARFKDAPTNVSHVKRVLKAYLELEDGSKWKLDGHKHPFKKGDLYNHIEHLTESHRTDLRRQDLWREIYVKFENLQKSAETTSEDQLQALYDVMTKLVPDKTL